MLKTIIAGSVVSVIIFAEVLAACLMLPGKEGLQAQAASQRADGQSAAADEDAGPGKTPGAGRSAPETEVDLGKFSIVVHNPDDRGTARINFHLIGTVEDRQREEFSQQLARCQHRLRDQVIDEVQNAEAGDLTDPGLALIKRKILERSNDLLAKPLLRTVVLSDYSRVEH
jgi:flagellar FliL protein